MAKDPLPPSGLVHPPPPLVNHFFSPCVDFSAYKLNLTCSKSIRYSFKSGSYYVFSVTVVMFIYIILSFITGITQILKHKPTIYRLDYVYKCNEGS